MVPVPGVFYESSALPDSVIEVVAHRFEVVQASQSSLAPGAEASFLVVPWAYDPSCARALWKDSSWVPSGVEVVFLLGPRRDAGASEPVFDVLGLHSPYPYGSLLASRSRVERSDDLREWLTPREYFDLVSALPVVRRPDQFARDGDEAQRVFGEGPVRWSTVFPGSEILRRFRDGWIGSGSW